MRRLSAVSIFLLLAGCTRFSGGTPVQRATLGVGDALAIANGISADFAKATTDWLEANCIPAEQLRDTPGPDRDAAFARCRLVRSQAELIQKRLEEAGEYLDQAEVYWSGLAQLQLSEGDEKARQLVILIQRAVADAISLMWVLRQGSEITLPVSADRALETLKGAP